MLLKILKKDFLRKKVITIAVFIFIMLSAMLISSGTNMLLNLSNSLDFLFERASAPHFTQSHSGKINQNRIDEWSADNQYVRRQQTCEMINIPGSKIYINSDSSENDTVMDNGFVRQNKYFDYLLDLNNKKIEVNEGEIAVPIYYMQRRNLAIGDKLVIKDKDLKLTFTITNFVRDVQMNPSMLNSKRFVVSAADFKKLKNSTGETEYLINFQLHDKADLQTFSNQYSHTDLPQKGPTIDYELLRIANSLTDGIIAAVIILISLLLSLISLLCLRFIILLTLEEDYREIGVMKAIGILPPDIRRIYLSKYFIMALTAALSGYLLSLFINNLFTKNIMLYIGTAPISILESILPLLTTFVIAILVIIFCMIVLRRFNKISAVEAIRMGNTGGTYSNNERLALYKSKFFNTNIFLGLRDVVLRFRTYIILFLVFILSTFIIIVPQNFLNTMQSPDFVTYMGIGRSDIIMDLRQSDQIRESFKEMVTYVKNDQDVIKYAPFVTCKYEVINQDGVPESLYIETGDFTIFPIDYLKGVAPLLTNEIALSYLSANELNKQVGDELELIIDGKRYSLIVSGIYQDITNGGKTAKAKIVPNHETASWYTININVNKDITSKAAEYSDMFKDVKVTDIEGYIQQTVANTIDQLKLLTITAIIIAGLVTILITSLFLKMLIAKDISQIAIMRSIGISLRAIKIQYFTRALLVLNLGIVVGTVTANTLGQRLLSAVLSIMGASRIEFIINPLEAYILSPMTMMFIVTMTTLVSTKSIRQYNIADINVE